MDANMLGEAGGSQPRFGRPYASSRCLTPGEEGVQLGDHRRPFPDGRPDPFHRTATDVAHGEDSFDSGLQRQQLSIVRTHVGAGADEALLVQRDAAPREPAGRRLGADEEEQVGNGVLLVAPGETVAPAHAT
jgi:hypothetical protein